LNRASAPQSFTRFRVYQRTDFFIPKLTDRSWRDLEPALAGTGAQELDSVLSWGGEWKGKARTTKHCAESCANDRRCISHAVHTSDLQEFFPEPESQVRPDPEPERCIALGLARVGRWDLRAAAFKEEVNLLCDSNKLKSWSKDISQIWSNC